MKPLTAPPNRNQAMHENPVVSFGKCASGTSSPSKFPLIIPRERRAGTV